ncbi:hypothetical protein QJS64_14320 [Paraclostridium bifermentans]|uniref:Lipoprotein n=1 Tax=Paraclostridium bifermentans TaxID=1490 RepID=A0ABY8R121_PARBF|nr:hypothetical protein QJS64_14320 [Paraclostridium bifermentans]
MKTKKSILSMILVLSLSVGLMGGCTHSDNSSKTQLKLKLKKLKQTKLLSFLKITQKTNTRDGLYEVKQDLSKKISKSIIDSGLSVADSNADGSFVLSLEDFESPPTKSIQSLYYSMYEDYKKGKSTIDIFGLKNILKIRN